MAVYMVQIGTKTLGLSKGSGPRFSLAPITKLGPIWDWTLKWAKGLYTKRPNCRTICKTGVHLLTQISCQMGFSPDELGPKYKVHLSFGSLIGPAQCHNILCSPIRLYSSGLLFSYFNCGQIGDETSFFVTWVATMLLFIYVFISFSSKHIDLSSKCVKFHPNLANV
jgi:hypothetical protein